MKSQEKGVRLKNILDGMYMLMKRYEAKTEYGL